MSDGPHVSVATHLLERYWQAASSCAKATGCKLCAKEAAQLRRELNKRRRLLGGQR